MRWIMAVSFWLVCVAIIPAKAAGIDFGRYHALVIGNNDYKHLNRLKTAVNDADHRGTFPTMQGSSRLLESVRIHVSSF